MNSRRLVLGLLLVGGLVGAWFAWEAYRKPKAAPVPEISLDGVDPVAADAVREALDAVREDPQSGPAWGKLAMQLHANGFSEHISRCYEVAERLEPNDRAWPYLHGIFLLDGNPSLGIPRLQRALTLNASPEEQAAIHYRLAMVMIEEAQLDSAENHLRALGQIEPNDPRVRLGIGMLAIARGNTEEARKKFAGLTEDQFFRKRACMMLASLVDEKESRRLKEHAMRLPGDRPSPDPLEERMRALKADRQKRIHPFLAMQSQGRNEEAFNFLRSVVAESPDRESCFLLAIELLKRNEIEEAEAMFRTAIRLEPSNAKSHMFLARILFQKGEQKLTDPEGKEAAVKLFGQALESTDNALALQQEYCEALLVRGPALHQLGRTDEAIQALRQAVLIRPEWYVPYMQLGTTLAESGKVEEGIQQLQIAVEIAGEESPKPRTLLSQWRAKAKPLPSSKE